MQMNGAGSVVVTIDCVVGGVERVIKDSVVFNCSVKFKFESWCC